MSYFIALLIRAGKVGENMEHTKSDWKMRKKCQMTYFIELENNIGTIVVFTNKPDKTEKTARLIAAAPDLLTACIEAQTAIMLLYELNKEVKIALGSGIQLKKAEKLLDAVIDKTVKEGE